LRFAIVYRRQPLAAAGGISRDDLEPSIVLHMDYVIKKERLPFALRQLL